MKRRVRKIANFFAFNLLFFALYLNFIHKDKGTTVSFSGETAIQQSRPAFSETVVANQPQEAKKEVAPAANSKAEQQGTTAMKLSIN